ncbi:SAC3 GANP family protein, putative [Babesia ovis]|uniref:SAC3 GANP family protein, putative n=1 Tax=Babesia ovis TaxID=5869 RepID=A0A9W5TB17_BABOV|nr:SAC3 GANP family protein, putative [Babesia ovis]
MDVIEAPKPTALDVSKRQPLIRRSVYVHEGVIARLETCERKLDSFRGSGLTYVLRSLNQYCHQLCPGKLLQALRILSDNQLFDRGTLYNLYTHIVKNILYFNSSQHRQLLQSISKCMAYTVQYSRVPSVEACSNLIAEINQLLPEEDMNTVSLQASKQAPTDNIANVVTNTETDNSIGGDMSHYANSVDISAFDGGPVPLSELNRLTSEIVSAVCSIYNWSNAQRRRIASLSDLGAIYSLCLDIYLRHSLTMDIKPRDILDIAYALSNHLAATFNDRLGWTTTTNASTALIKDANVIADSMSWILFDTLRNILSSSDSDTNCFSKQPIKLDILQETKQLRDNYIHGNISSLHLVVSTFQCHRPGSQDGNHAQLWRLDTQNTINALRRLGHQINRICQVFLAHHEILPSFIRLLSLSCAFSAVLPLFDKNGQCITDNPDLFQNTTKTQVQHIGPMTLLSDVSHHIPQLDVKTTFNILSIVSYTNLESNDSFLLDIRSCPFNVMATNPPDYFSIPSGDGSGPASMTLRNPLLRPLENDDVGSTLLKYQEIPSFLKRSSEGRMVGEVLGMCPPKEIKQKLEMNTASDLERVNASTVNPKLALKSFQRSDASRVFKPEETRPAVWCRRTIYNILCYFVDADIRKKSYLLPKDFSYLDVYNFLRDRLRSIWQDLTVQHCAKHRAYIECFEISIRFLIYSNEILCENDEYDIAQNRGLLNTCLDKLMEGYEAVHKYVDMKGSCKQWDQLRAQIPHFQDIVDVLVYRSPHEAEFWGYRMLMHIPQLLVPGGSATFCDIRQRMPKELRDTFLVKFAMEVCHTAASGNLHRYFTLMRDPQCPGLYAALMNRFAVCLRVQFMETLVNRKIAKLGVNPLDMETFNSMFGFVDEPLSNVEKFLTKYEVTVYDSEGTTYLDLENANGQQLQYDCASLQKLTNKFQTSSNVVHNKCDAIPSRQLIFDPDFEYPVGTGPDTCGTAFVYEKLNQKSDQSNLMSTDISIDTDDPNKSKGGSSFISSNPFGIAGSTTSSNFTFGTPSDGKPFAGFGFPPASTETTSIFGKQLQTPTALFGTASMINNPNPFAPKTTQAESSPFTFGVPKTTQAESTPFTFGVPKNTQAESTQPPLFNVTPANSGTNIFGSVKSDVSKDHSDNIAFSFKQPKPADSDPNKDETQSSIFGTIPKPADATSDSSNDKALFSFAVPSIPIADSKPNIFARLEETDSTKSKEANSGDTTDLGPPPLFGGTASVIATTGSATTENTITATTDAKNTTNSSTSDGSTSFTTTTDANDTCNATADISTTPDTTTNTITSVSVPQQSKKPESHQAESLSLLYERSKLQKSVTLVKPKVVKAISKPHVTIKAHVTTGRGILSHLCKVVTSLVDTVISGMSTTAQDINTQLLVNGEVIKPPKKPCRRPECSSDADAYNDAPSCNGINVNIPPIVPSTPNKYLSEWSPMDVTTHRSADILYLNRQGSSRYLHKRYVNYIFEKKVMRIIKGCYSCGSCYHTRKNNLYKLITTVGNSSFILSRGLCRVLGSVMRHTFNITGSVVTYVRKRLREDPMNIDVLDSDDDDSDYLESGQEDIMDNDSFSDESYSQLSNNDIHYARHPRRNRVKHTAAELLYSDMTSLTEDSFKDLAISTRNHALATGRYIASVYNRSSRLLNKISDYINDAMRGDSYPLEGLLQVTIERLDDIKERSLSCLGEMFGNTPIHQMDIWATGIFWHIAFFNPIEFRPELIPPNSVYDLNRDNAISSINQYETSDYTLRLKEDVLSIAGFDISAHRLLPGAYGHKRSMIQCCVSRAKHAPDNGNTVTSDSIPICVGASVCVKDDGTEVFNQSDLGYMAMNTNIDTGCQQPIYHYNNTSYGLYRTVCEINQLDPRYNNSTSIALHANSIPFYIGKETYFHELFTSDSMPDIPCNGTYMSPVDCYGVLSALLCQDQREIGGHYQTCLLCYRISVCMLDLLCLYEFFNTSLPNTVSFCGCADKNYDMCYSRLRQTLDTIEERLLTEVIRYAYNLDISIDPSQLRSRITFGCMGFELYHPRGVATVSNIDIHNATVTPNNLSHDKTYNCHVNVQPIPRLVYPDGFSHGLRAAAEATLRSQTVYVLQRPFEIPDLLGFLSGLLKSQLNGMDNVTSLSTFLRDGLDKAIAYVEAHVPSIHWDVYQSDTILQDVEVVSDTDTSELSRYSKASFVSLLRMLQSAADRASQHIGSHGLNMDTATQIINCVLSRVRVRSYYVPYSVGLYMSHVSG